MTARSQAEDVAVVLAAAEAHRALRPATDPTNLAGLVITGRYLIDSKGRHAAPVQSFETDRAEYLADRDPIVREHAARHVAGGAE